MVAIQDLAILDSAFAYAHAPPTARRFMAGCQERCEGGGKIRVERLWGDTRQQDKLVATNVRHQLVLHRAGLRRRAVAVLRQKAQQRKTCGSVRGMSRTSCGGHGKHTRAVPLYPADRHSHRHCAQGSSSHTSEIHPSGMRSLHIGIHAENSYTFAGQHYPHGGTIVSHKLRWEAKLREWGGERE